MPRVRLEVAEIFRKHGSAWRRANAGHVSLSQLKVMSSIEACRTEALGGHVAACTKCDHQHIAYNEPRYSDDPAPLTLREPCPCCGGTMLIIETFKRGQIPRSRAPPRKQAA